MTFLDMQTFLGRVLKGNFLVLVAIKKLAPIDCNVGHHQFLPSSHRFRHVQRSFNGKKELRLTLRQLSGVVAKVRTT